MDQAIWLSRAIHRADEERRRQELMQMLLDPAAAAAAAASLMMPNLRSQQNLENREQDSNPGPKTNSHHFLQLGSNNQQSNQNSSSR
jgi:hypothetical protein